jgi:hypothetical protein
MRPVKVFRKDMQGGDDGSERYGTVKKQGRRERKENKSGLVCERFFRDAPANHSRPNIYLPNIVSAIIEILDFSERSRRL